MMLPKQACDEVSGCDKEIQSLMIKKWPKARNEGQGSCGTIEEDTRARPRKDGVAMKTNVARIKIGKGVPCRRQPSPHSFCLSKAFPDRIALVKYWACVKSELAMVGAICRNKALKALYSEVSGSKPAVLDTIATVITGPGDLEDLHKWQTIYDLAEKAENSLLRTMDKQPGELCHLYRWAADVAAVIRKLASLKLDDGVAMLGKTGVHRKDLTSWYPEMIRSHRNAFLEAIKSQTDRDLAVLTNPLVRPKRGNILGKAQV